MSYGLLSCIIAAFCWGVSPLMQKYALQQMTVAELNVARGLGILLTTLPFFGQSMLFQISPHDYSLLFFMAFFNNIIGDVLLFISIRTIGVSLASPISSAYPLIVALISWLYLKDSPSPLVLLGTCLIIGGLILLNLQKESHEKQKKHLLGAIAALGAAFCWAIGLLINRQLIANGLSPFAVTFWRGFFFNIMAFLFLVFTYRSNKNSWSRLRSFSLSTWIYATGAGILALVVGAIAYSTSLKTLPVTVATPIAASSPFIAALGGWYAFGEYLRYHQWLGVALVILGAIAVAW